MGKSEFKWLPLWVKKRLNHLQDSVELLESIECLLLSQQVRITNDVRLKRATMPRLICHL